MTFIADFAWELAAIGYVVLGVIFWIRLKMFAHDMRLINGQVKYWQSKSERLEKKQQPRLKNGRYARKTHFRSTMPIDDYYPFLIEENK